MMQPNRVLAVCVRLRAFWQSILFLVAGIVVLGLVLCRSPRESAALSSEAKTPDKALPAASGTLPTLIGTASCSARGCHGALDGVEDPKVDKCRQDEYVKWTRDPHADAFRVLFDERSVRIAKNLGGPPAHDNKDCLACHSTPQSVNLRDSPLGQSERQFGVGCESCHGNAGTWVVEHTSLSKFSDPEERKKKRAAIGMVDVWNLAPRADMCVGCHVGAPADSKKGLPLRDVNHDLIAAGHPRLQFEFGTFQANMPTHWRKQEYKEAQLWVIGQFATAQASLELLEDRANAQAKLEKLADRTKVKDRPWPELTEYDCFACHHSLAAPSWRQTKHEGRRMGAFPWGTWSFAFTRPLLDSFGAEGADLRKSLDDLTSTMHKPLPKHEIVAAQTKEAKKKMSDLVAKLAQVMPESKAQKLIRAIAQKDSSTKYLSWDEAEQIYLALHALHDAEKSLKVDQRDPKIAVALRELTNVRAWHKDFESPLRFNGNPAFGPKEFLKGLEGLKPPSN